MKTIPLTKGLVGLVDDEDFERVNQYKWTTAYSKALGIAYAQRSVKINGKWTHVLLHRVIMNAKKGQRIDHADGNGVNNQKYNLRLCTPAENQRNVKCHRDNVSGFKGVKPNRNSRRNPWSSFIFVNGRTKYLGCYPSRIDAAIAYNIAAIGNFKEFARLNPVPFVNAAR